MPQPSITKIRLKITYLKFHWNFSGANVKLSWIYLMVRRGTAEVIPVRWGQNSDFSDQYTSWPRLQSCHAGSGDLTQQCKWYPRVSPLLFQTCQVALWKPHRLSMRRPKIATVTLTGMHFALVYKHFILSKSCSWISLPWQSRAYPYFMDQDSSSF